MVLVFEKERGSNVVTTEISQTELVFRLAPINEKMANLICFGFLIGIRDKIRRKPNFLRYVRPVFEDSMKKKIAHICSITDIF